METNNNVVENNAEEKRVIPVWLSTVMGLLVIVSLIYYVSFSIANHNFASIVAAVIYCCASACAFIYCLFGYKKDNAKFFKIYAIAFAAHHLQHVFMAAMVHTGVVAICHAIGFGVVLVLIMALDLGKKKSYGLAIADMIVSAIPFFVALFDGLQPIGCLPTLTLSIVLMIMVAGKYSDKAKRGSK